VLARVGETTLTLCDFARRLAGQNPYLRARLNTPEARRSLVRAWVDAELMALEARSRGLDREPSVRNAVLSQLARQVESEVRAAVPAAEVSEADVERYYRDHIREYETPEQVRFSQIVLSSRADADRVLAEAQRVAGDDAAWRALVRRETRDEASRETGGDQGFQGREGSGQVPAEVAEAAFRLRDVGQVLPEVVQSARGGPSRGPGFHVLRMIARREALRRPLDDVRRAIRNRLFEERNDQAQTRAVRELLERLRRETSVQVDESVLSSVRLDVPPGTPPAIRAGVGQPLLPPGTVIPAAGAQPR
jgi:parvulin-like peptidyl-prolyl isomerase